MNSIVKLVYRWNRGSLATPDFFCTPFVVTAEESTAVILGNLYNWYAVSNADNIANTGWSAPTKANLETLETYLGGSAVAGGKLKETGVTYWDAPNTGATNEVGFNMRGTGFRKFDNASFSDIGLTGALYTTTIDGIGNPYDIDVIHNTAATSIHTTFKTYGFTVRLIKDTTLLTHGQTGTYIGNDSKVYQTICIGTQEWMSESLSETKYRNGNLIPEITDSANWLNDVTGARCFYNNDPLNA
jgi:uncharacterized protein (TIGR02145 family)